MNQNENCKIIRTLDTPLRFVYWEYSQVLFCAIGFLVGLLGSQNLLCSLLIAVFSLVAYKKVKKRLAKNFKRFSYWTFFSKNVKRFPPSYKRRFIR